MFSLFGVNDDLNLSDKIHFENIDFDIETSKVDIKSKDIENVSILIEVSNNYIDDNSRYNYKDITIDEAKDFLKQHRNNVKEYFSKSNEEIFNEIDFYDLVDYFKIDNYAPYFYADIDRELTDKDIITLNKIALNENVLAIYVHGNYQAEIVDALEAMEADDYVSNSDYNGSDIVVGILDEGIVDDDNQEFTNNNLIILDELFVNEQVSDHATKVAICATSVASNCELLSAQATGSINDEIDWMLDNFVSVINMSIGYSEHAGNYSSHSAYCDYIAKTNYVVFTGSAGNRGNSDALVTPPNGFNTITVGACDNDGIRCNFSSYEENFDIYFPNVLAPGKDLYISDFVGTHSGTSFSSPFVAGLTAVLMQQDPLLVVFPEDVLSLLMCSAKRLTIYSHPSGLDDEAGSGMVSLANALEAIDNRTDFFNATDNLLTPISTKSVYINSGERIRIAFISMVNNNNSTNIYNLVTDYDLYLYDSNNVLVASSIGTSNIEFIDYLATNSGTYYINIKQYDLKNTNEDDYCSYCFYID
jgi:subtilisin family serine protease